LFLLIGVGLAGKEAADAVKTRIKRLFRRRTPSQPVSKLRYQIGLWGFFGSIVLSWIWLYLGVFNPEWVTFSWRLILIGLDGITVLSFFILGDSFYDKFKSLFVW